MTAKELKTKILAYIDREKEGLVGDKKKDFINSLSEESVSEDLEDAAKHYLYSNILYDDVYVGNPTDKDCIEMFKAGAKWQEKQMMYKAVDAIPCSILGKEIIYTDLPKEIEVGDKVKVIILKED